VGWRYDVVVWSRLEMVWVAPHPLLQDFGSDCGAWIPLGEDYGGVNDRHAVLQRDVADVFFARWDILYDGRIMKVHPCLSRGAICAMNNERCLAVLLRHYNVSVCRFPSASFLGCCKVGGVRQCSKATCQTRVVWTNTTADGTRERQLVHGKYPTEMTTAAMHSAAWLSPGAHLMRRSTAAGEAHPAIAASSAVGWSRHLHSQHSLVLHIPTSGRSKFTEMVRQSKLKFWSPKRVLVQFVHGESGQLVREPPQCCLVR